MGRITRRGSLALAAAVAATLAVAPGAVADIEDGDEASPTFGAGSVTRLAGNDRIETAIKASQAMGNVGDTVIITRDLEYADALASASLADLYDAPVLLNPTASLDARVKAELERLHNDGAGVTQAIIIGGESAISASVQQEIEKIFGEVDAEGNVIATNVERVGGVDRYDTAVQIAERVAGEGNPALLEALQQAEQRLADYLAAQPNLEAALEALQEAAANLAPAYADVEEAQEVLVAAQARVLELTQQLEAVPGFEDSDWTEYGSDWETAIAAIQEDATAAGDDLAAALDAQETLSGLVAIDADATLQQFIDGEVGELTEEEIAAVETAAEIAGLGLDVTATEAEAAVSAQIEGPEGLEAVAQAAGELLAAILADYQEFAAETTEVNENNAAVLAQLAEANAAIVDAEDALAEAYEALGEAQVAYRQAVADVEEAAGEFEGEPVTLQQLQDAVDEARAALVAGSDHEVLLTTGLKFPDALTAGALSGQLDGVVLLTRGSEFDNRGYTEAYLEANTAEVIAIGGPAAAAIGDDADQTVVGKDRFETAALVASEFYGEAEFVGIARGYDARYPNDEAPAAADAVLGAAFMANADSPLVLTWSDELPGATADYLELNEPTTGAFIFGGPNAVSRNVENAVEDLLND